MNHTPPFVSYSDDYEVVMQGGGYVRRVDFMTENSQYNVHAIIEQHVCGNWMLDENIPKIVRCGKRFADGYPCTNILLRANINALIVTVPRLISKRDILTVHIQQSQP